MLRPGLSSSGRRCENNSLSCLCSASDMNVLWADGSPDFRVAYCTAQKVSWHFCDYLASLVQEKSWGLAFICRPDVLIK